MEKYHNLYIYINIYIKIKFSFDFGIGNILTVALKHCSKITTIITLSGHFEIVTKSLTLYDTMIDRKIKNNLVDSEKVLIFAQTKTNNKT